MFLQNITPVTATTGAITSADYGKEGQQDP